MWWNAGVRWGWGPLRRRRTSATLPTPCVAALVNHRAATLIQACMRGHVGRKRLRAMRFVRQFSRLATEAADALKPKVLEELAALVRSR